MPQVLNRVLQRPVLNPVELVKAWLDDSPFIFRDRTDGHHSLFVCGACRTHSLALEDGRSAKRKQDLNSLRKWSCSSPVMFHFRRPKDKNVKHLAGDLKG